MWKWRLWGYSMHCTSSPFCKMVSVYLTMFPMSHNNGITQEYCNISIFNDVSHGSSESHLRFIFIHKVQQQFLNVKLTLLFPQKHITGKYCRATIFLYCYVLWLLFILFSYFHSVYYTHCSILISSNIFSYFPWRWNLI